MPTCININVQLEFFFFPFFTICRQIVGKRSVIRNCYRKRCAPQTCSNSTFLRFPPFLLHSRYNYLAVARVSRADPVAWWWNKEKGGGTGASRDKVSRSPPGAVSPTKESPWENGRPSSQVTFSSHRRPSTVPLAFSFFSFFFFSFPYSSPSVGGPLEKSKRRKEFPWDREAFSFSAGLYQDTLGLRRNLGFCNGGTLNGVPTFSCWRDHLICIMLLVLLGW